jgi:hypothetical protein
MAPTQYLNVLRVFLGTSLRVSDDVIEMKSGSRFTLHAATPIALPYFELHPAWYELIVFQRSWTTPEIEILNAFCAGLFNLPGRLELKAWKLVDFRQLDPSRRR